MQTVGCPLSSFPAPERVDIYADLPGKSRFAQAKLVPERGNLLRREFAFDCRALRRQEAISGNKVFEQVAARSNWRILASLPSAMVDSSMPSFCESLLLGQSQGDSKPLQFSDQVVGFWQGIVPKEGDNPRKAMHHRLNFVAFPVARSTPCRLRAVPPPPFAAGRDPNVSSGGDLPMFSSASDRLFAAVWALKAVHGKKATQG